MVDEYSGGGTDDPLVVNYNMMGDSPAPKEPAVYRPPESPLDSLRESDEPDYSFMCGCNVRY